MYADIQQGSGEKQEKQHLYNHFYSKCEEKSHKQGKKRLAPVFTMVSFVIIIRNRDSFHIKHIYLCLQMEHVAPVQPGRYMDN